MISRLDGQLLLNIRKRKYCLWFLMILSVISYNSNGQDGMVKASPAISCVCYPQSHSSGKEEKSLIIFQMPVTYNKFYSELRFNYDQLDTWGVFGGRRLLLADSGQTLTPQLGVLFGTYKGTGVQIYYNLARSGIEVNSQNEYIHSLQNTAHFYFNWSEVKFSIWKKFQAGVAEEYYYSFGFKSFDIGLAFVYRSRKMTYYIYAYDLYKLHDGFLYAGIQKTINFLRIQQPRISR